MRQLRAVVLCAAVMVASFGVLVLVASWMWATARYDPAPILPHDYRDPVLALELARTADEVSGIVRFPESAHNREVLLGQIRKDWLFLAGYCVFFVALGLAQFATEDPVRHALGVIVILGIVLTAEFDFLENLGMRRELAAPWVDLSDELVGETRGWSLWKWLACFGTSLAAGLLLIDARPGRSPVGRVVQGVARVSGFAMMAAGLLGMWGLASPRALPWALSLLALGMLAATILALLIVAICTPLFARGASSGAGRSHPGRRWLPSARDAILAGLAPDESAGAEPEELA
jgi:hypothetical protein